MYANRCFTIKIYNGDNTFNILSERIGKKILNIVGREEHVPTIEKLIRIKKKEQDVIIEK